MGPSEGAVTARLSVLLAPASHACPALLYRPSRPCPPTPAPPPPAWLGFPAHCHSKSVSPERGIGKRLRNV